MTTTAHRVVPNLPSQALTENREFYAHLGLEEVMNQGWITTLASPTNPTAQLSLLTHDETAPVIPDLSIEVDDVDTAHTAMQTTGAEILHPLQNEPWGVRRFFVRSPTGHIINVLSHT